MGNDQLNYEDLVQIFELIEKSSRLAEFRLKVGDLEIDMRMRAPGADAGAHAPRSHETEAPQGGELSDSVAIAPPAPAGEAPPAPRLPPGAVLVSSPTIGTFYRALEPGAKPYVDVGSRVTADTTVCIIEVMKLMNSLPAGVSGVVTHILAIDAQLVAADQPLIVIDPAA